jgi:hypothetical protein
MTPALLFRQLSVSQLWSDSAAFHSLAEIRIATSKRLEFPPTK